VTGHELHARMVAHRPGSAHPPAARLHGPAGLDTHDVAGCERRHATAGYCTNGACRCTCHPTNRH